MSTLLEVAGLAALSVGAFLLLSTGLALVVTGAAVFLYAQSVDDSRAKSIVASLKSLRHKPPRAH